MSAPLAFLLVGADAGERHARLREMRALALVFLGKSDPATIALGEAIADPAAIPYALKLLDATPALRKRRLLAAYQVLLPRSRR